ncbi:hypothetical protein H0H93_000003 [Arthromyces matolae]|nr:hypothetical protein H0H93_000003 [Arthromyces matolae]
MGVMTILFKPFIFPFIRPPPFPIFKRFFSSMPTATNRRLMYADTSPMLTFDDPLNIDNDNLIFDFEDLSSPTSPNTWQHPFINFDDDVKPSYPIDPSPPADNRYFDSTVFRVDKSSPQPEPHLNLAHWINDPDLSLASPSSPIPIPQSTSLSSSQASSSFFPYQERIHFPQTASFSPSEFASHAVLPRSLSPTSSEDPYSPRQRIDSISPQDISFDTSSPWSSQLYPSRALRSASRPSVRHSPMAPESTVRQRATSLRADITSPLLFTSLSAPTYAEPSMSRPYSHRAQSVSANDDPDATVRRKKRSPPAEDRVSKAEPVLKSLLRPPKLAPSAWQLYFTDWIQKQQTYGTRKLNVAQAAKEAGQEYASLSNEDKEPYKRRSQAAKEARERELAAYMRTLTPDDIKRENLFRAAQRKAGKSRKSNIKDPNAPKKPLSAYFMFLQRIRANPHLVRDIFGDETETTKQSVLAAAKWRSMTDAERQPFLAQAEQEKMEYEAARRIYEEGAASSYGSSNINFSILPNSPPFPTFRLESESENEPNVIDDNIDPALRI